VASKALSSDDEIASQAPGRNPAQPPAVCLISPREQSATKREIFKTTRASINSIAEAAHGKMAVAIPFPDARP
jgi:hypothetical protein